jgi:hypothetical protein
MWLVLLLVVFYLYIRQKPAKSKEPVFEMARSLDRSPGFKLSILAEREYLKFVQNPGKRGLMEVTRRLNDIAMGLPNDLETEQNYRGLIAQLELHMKNLL